MAVTPTPAAYGRDNPRLLGRSPEVFSGPRVWVETPGPPVLGKERSPENLHIFGERPIPSTGFGRFCFRTAVRPGNGELYPRSTTDHDPSRQIRPPDHRPAHLHHRPL